MTVTQEQINAAYFLVGFIYVGFVMVALAILSFLLK